jgi:hypothetical protein
LEAVVDEFCRFHDADPTLFRFLLLVQHQALPRVGEGRDNPVAVLRAMLAEASEAGETPVGNPDLATAMLLGLLVQPATAIVYGRLAAPLSRYVPDMVAACRRALGVEC